MQTRIAVVIVIAVLAVGAAGYGWYASGQSPASRAIEMSVSDTACRQAAAACRAQHPALGDVRLVFPEGAYYLRPFMAELNLEGDPVTTLDSVMLDLSMPGMDMGRNVFRLKPDDTDGHLWRGKLLLPICVTGRVDWDVRLQITSGRQRYEAHFPLEVKRYQQP